MALLYPAAVLMMKLIPDVTAFFMLKKTDITPEALFFGKNQTWVLFAVLWGMLRFCILTPLLCSVCSWFAHYLGLNARKQNFFQTGLFFRSLKFFGMTEFIRFLALSPFVSACLLTAYAFRRSTLTEEAGFWLFMMIQALAAAVWMGIFYIRFCVNLSAMPFLFLEDPSRPVLKSIRISWNLLRHQHGKLALILLTGVFLPYTVTMLMLFLQIRIREYFQEKTYQEARA